MARAATRIIVEPANPLLAKKDVTNPNKMLNVCAYARVSTDNKEQLSSYKHQVSYYKGKIMDKPCWNFIDVYTDEGITATSTLKRAGFNKMLKMCRKGKIDLIITKSVSRFARNTVDSLKICRELKAKGIGVIFEKEGINTLEDNVEIYLAITFSMAQEESRNISENVKWGFKRKFENGGIVINTKRFLGYDKGENDNLIINKKEAEMVTLIFDLFLEGNSYGGIARELKKRGIKTITGNSTWSASTIPKILANEKYAGNCISQKSYTPDYLSHRRDKNRGERAKYIIEGNHEAIIPTNKFKEVQIKLAEVNKNWNGERGIRTVKSGHLLSNLLFCSKCGSPMRRKTQRSHNGKNEVYYGCKQRIDKNGKCEAEYVTEKQLKTGIVQAIPINYKILYKDDILHNENLQTENLSEYNEDLVKKVVNRIVVKHKRSIDIYILKGDL